MTSPSLLYLTIYNTSLTPEDSAGGNDEDEEDAEEQAQILFYTSQERAVSRDRMLRQVGLAKAMVNFSSMFHTPEACTYVHSQSRRMLMLSPEQDFWIHAGVELAKAPRPVKGKVVADKNQKGKSKPSDTLDPQEASVHDLALRAQLMHSYERFRLTHGSFTTILDTLGREALELQLERHFTVWAWSWDLDNSLEFAHQFPVPVHPLLKEIEQHLDSLCSQSQQECVSSVLITPPYYSSSQSFRSLAHPTSIIPFLAGLIPPPTPPPNPDTNISNTYPEPPSDPAVPPVGISGSDGSNTFLGMPTMSLETMSVKKWRWPGYLTIGKGSKKPSPPLTDVESPQRTSEDQSSAQDKHSSEEAVKAMPQEVGKSDAAPSPPPETTTTQAVVIDQRALDDAMSEQDLNPISESSSGSISGSESSHESDTNSADLDVSLQTPTPSRLFGIPEPLAEAEIVSPPPTFASRKVHLTSAQDPSHTFASRVHYIERNGMLLALVGFAPENVTSEDMSQLALRAEVIIQEARQILGTHKNDSESTSDMKEQFIASIRKTTVSSNDFSSKSEHLFNGQQLLEERTDMDMSEVFSKSHGSKQQWVLCRRGLGIDSRTGEDISGQVYFEVLKKDATLPDVDNLMSSVIKTYTH